MESDVARRTEELKHALENLQQGITERKRAEEELHRTIESLRNAFGTTVQVMISAIEIRDPYTAWSSDQNS